jgi:cytoskeletal protein CcmA (bactofilin family)
MSRRLRTPCLAARPRFRPYLEGLEDRTLPSASVTVSVSDSAALVANPDLRVYSTRPPDESEMSVAVNPTNPLNIAGFTHNLFNPDEMSVFYSTDGGSSWNRTVIGAGNDNGGAGKRTDPAIAFDANGNLFISYLHLFTASDGTPMTSVIVGLSADGGQSFAQFTTVEARKDLSGLPGVDRDALATGMDPISGRQAVYVAYSENVSRSPDDQRIVVAGSNDGGATFTAPVRVDDGGSSDGRLAAAVAVGPGGELYVAWHDYGSDHHGIFFDRDLDGLWGGANDFGTDITVRSFSFSGQDLPISAQPTRGINFDPTIAVDRSNDPFRGRVYIAFTDEGATGEVDDTDVYLTSSGDQGAHWQGLGHSGNVESSTGSDFLPTVAVDQSSGGVYVIYYTTDGFQDSGNKSVNVRLAVSTDGGATFRYTKMTGESSNAGAADALDSADFNFGEYIGVDAFDGAVHGFWAANRSPGNSTEGSYNHNLKAWTGTASLAGGVDVFIRGDNATNAFKVGLDPTNPLFLRVQDNGNVVFDGLAASVDAISLVPGAGTNTIDIADLPAQATVFVNDGASGPDTVTVGSNHTLATIAGTVEIAGSLANPGTLIVDDSQDSGSYSNVTLDFDPTASHGRLSGLGPGNVSWSRDSGVTLSAVNIKAGAGTDKFTLTSPTASFPLNLDTGSGNDTVNVLRTRGALTITGTGHDTVTVGDRAPSLGGSLAAFTGAVNVNTASPATLILDASADAAKTVTLTNHAVTGLAPVDFNYLSGALGRLEIHAGGGSSLDTGAGGFAGNFAFTLQPFGFTAADLHFLGDFSGSFLAPDLGTAAAPAKEIVIDGSVTATHVIKVNFLDTFHVGGDMGGTLNGYGDVAGTDTIRQITVGGTFTATGRVIAPVLDQMIVNEYAGHVQETEPGKDLQLLQITGSLEATGTVEAASIATMTVGQDLAGTVTVTGPITTLTVGGTLSGSVTAVSIGALTVGGDLSGTVTVTQSLGTLDVGGDTTGEINAPSIAMLSSHHAHGPVVLKVGQGGVKRRLVADLVSGASLAGVTFAYVYEGAGPGDPRVTVRVTNPDPAGVRFDLSLVTYNDAAKFDLARLDAAGASGIRNVSVEGDVLTDVTPAAASLFPGDGNPAGVRLPLDDLAGVGVRDFVPNASIQAASIQAVAFGSHAEEDGGVETGALARAEDGADLLAPGTAIAQATDTYRVPFADLATQQVQLFAATAAGGGFFDDNGIVLEVQGVSSPNATNTGNVVTPSNVARGAAVALVKVVPTFDKNGQPQNSAVSSIDVSGDGASVQTRQWVADHITSTGPLGDLILQSGRGVTDVTAPSLFGSLLANGPITGTVQTTGQRTDPITGAVSVVPADLGRLYVDTSAQPNPVLATTLVQARGPGLSGRVIVRGNLISQVAADGGVSGLIAVQGSVLETTAPSADGSRQVRLGGIVSNGNFQGQMVVLGRVLGDVVLHGSLKNGGRIAVKGDVLGNMILDGGIDVGSALVVAGNVGSAALGTALSVNGDVKGILAVEQTVVFDHAPSVKRAAFFGTNLATGDPTSAAAIDAICTSLGQPLAFDLSGLDLGGLGLILKHLGALGVGANGHLVEPLP